MEAGEGGTSVVFPRPESPTTSTFTCLRCHIFRGLGRREPSRLALLVEEARTLMNSCSSVDIST